MNDTVLTRERILETAEDVLRRYGPAKATVVDVARALDVSHGSVYRHFPSKAALRDAVVGLWLERARTPLDAVVAESGPAPKKLRRWFEQMRVAKRAHTQQDPEIFAAYLALANEARDVVQAYKARLAAGIAAIITEGVARGEFAPVADPIAAAWVLMHATTRFHNPAHASEWNNPGMDAEFDALWALLMKGLGAAEVAAPVKRKKAVVVASAKARAAAPRGPRRAR